MANTNAPFGLKPLRYRGGAPYNGAMNPYHVKSDYGTALFIGDPVIKTGTANTAALSVPGGGYFDVATLPDIQKATVGDANKITGVIVGFAALPTDLTKQYNPASTERVAFVCDDPNVVFAIQCDGAVNAVDVGQNAVLIYTQNGSTTSGMSGVEMDSGTTTAFNTTNTFQLKILRAMNRGDVDSTLIRSKVEVLINNHTEANITLGI